MTQQTDLQPKSAQALTPAKDARERDLPRRELPGIDLGPYLKGEPGALEALSLKWRDVCENLGFLCIVNHGISDELIAEMESATRAFHALPDEEKLKIIVLLYGYYN